jgi:hypothetical protein
MRKLKERVVEQHVRRTSFTRSVKQVEQTCPVCKREFWGARTRKYCSQPCRQKANYERHAQEYRRERVERYRAGREAEAKEKRSGL